METKIGDPKPFLEKPIALNVGMVLNEEDSALLKQYINKYGQTADYRKL